MIRSKSDHELDPRVRAVEYPTVNGLEEPSTGKSTTPADVSEEAPSRDRPCRARSRALRYFKLTPFIGNALSSLSIAGNPSPPLAPASARWSAAAAQAPSSRIQTGLRIRPLKQPFHQLFSCPTELLAEARRVRSLTRASDEEMELGEAKGKETARHRCSLAASIGAHSQRRSGLDEPVRDPGSVPIEPTGSVIFCTVPDVHCTDPDPESDFLSV